MPTDNDNDNSYFAKMTEDEIRDGDPISVVMDGSLEPPQPVPSAGTKDSLTDALEAITMDDDETLGIGGDETPDEKTHKKWIDNEIKKNVPDVPESLGGKEKTDDNGLVYLEYTFTVDPSKYRSNNYQPINDVASAQKMMDKPSVQPQEVAKNVEEVDVVAEEKTTADSAVEAVVFDYATELDGTSCWCFDEDEGIDYSTIAMDAAPKAPPTKQTCKTTFAQCRAKNPLFCRFHGPKLLEKDIKQTLNALLKNKVHCTVSITKDKKAKSPTTFRMTVGCPPQYKKIVDTTIHFFLSHNPGISSSEDWKDLGSDSEKISKTTEFEMDILKADKPPKKSEDPKGEASLKKVKEYEKKGQVMPVVGTTPAKVEKMANGEIPVPQKSAEAENPEVAKTQAQPQEEEIDIEEVSKKFADLSDKYDYLGTEGMMGYLDKDPQFSEAYMDGLSIKENIKSLKADAEAGKGDAWAYKDAVEKFKQHLEKVNKMKADKWEPAKSGKAQSSDAEETEDPDPKESTMDPEFKTKLADVTYALEAKSLTEEQKAEFEKKIDSAIDIEDVEMLGEIQAELDKIPDSAAKGTNFTDKEIKDIETAQKFIKKEFEADESNSKLAGMHHILGLATGVVKSGATDKEGLKSHMADAYSNYLDADNPDFTEGMQKGMQMMANQLNLGDVEFDGSNVTFGDGSTIGGISKDYLKMSAEDYYNYKNPTVEWPQGMVAHFQDILENSLKGRELVSDNVMTDLKKAIGAKKPLIKALENAVDMLTFDVGEVFAFVPDWAKKVKSDSLQKDWNETVEKMASKLGGINEVIKINDAVNQEGFPDVAKKWSEGKAENDINAQKEALSKLHKMADTVVKGDYAPEDKETQEISEYVDLVGNEIDHLTAKYGNSPWLLASPQCTTLNQIVKNNLAQCKILVNQLKGYNKAIAAIEKEESKGETISGVLSASALKSSKEATIKSFNEFKEGLEKKLADYKQAIEDEDKNHLDSVKASSAASVENIVKGLVKEMFPNGKDEEVKSVGDLLDFKMDNLKKEAKESGMTPGDIDTLLTDSGCGKAYFNAASASANFDSMVKNFKKDMDSEVLPADYYGETVKGVGKVANELTNAYSEFKQNLEKAQQAIDFKKRLAAAKESVASDASSKKAEQDKKLVGTAYLLSSPENQLVWGGFLSDGKIPYADNKKFTDAMKKAGIMPEGTPLKTNIISFKKDDEQTVDFKLGTFYGDHTKPEAFKEALEEAGFKDVSLKYTKIPGAPEMVNLIVPQQSGEDIGDSNIGGGHNTPAAPKKKVYTKEMLEKMSLKEKLQVAIKIAKKKLAENPGDGDLSAKLKKWESQLAAMK